jgi:hypothetical protein
MDQPEARFRTASAIVPPLCLWAQADTNAGAEAVQPHQKLRFRMYSEIEDIVR